jgi:hypothetical protein
VLEWLRANGCPWDVETCEYAAGAGHLAVLQWALPMAARGMQTRAQMQLRAGT